MERVGDMTREELKRLVGEVVEEQVGRLLHENGTAKRIGEGAGKARKRSWEETSKEIDRIGWTPPPGAQSPLDMLRADRDG